MFLKRFLLPSSTNSEDDVEAGKNLLNTLTTKTQNLLSGGGGQQQQRQNYDYCFPEDVWFNITEYLTFLQIAKLSEVNHFFNSICKPILKNAKVEKFRVQIKIENDSIQFGSTTKECSIKGLTILEMKSFISKCLDERGLFPVKELSLEQNLAYFSKKWITRWSIILEQIIPVRPFIVSLKMKNLHLSKRQFLKFIIHSKTIKGLTFENVVFDEKIYIGKDLFEKLPSLEAINVTKSPSIFCDEIGQKFAVKCMYGQYIYCRSGCEFRAKSRPNVPCKNFNVKTFWILKFIPFLYAIFTYIFLCLAYLNSNNLNTLLAAFISPAIFLAISGFSLHKLLNSQRFLFFPKLACFFQLKIKTMKKIPFFLYPFLYMFILFLIVIYFGLNFVNSCLSQKIDELTLIQLRIPFICSIFYFVFSCFMFSFLNFIEKHKK